MEILVCWLVVSSFMSLSKIRSYGNVAIAIEKLQILGLFVRLLRTKGLIYRSTLSVTQDLVLCAPTHLVTSYDKQGVRTTYSNQDP